MIKVAGGRGDNAIGSCLNRYAANSQHLGCRPIWKPTVYSSMISSFKLPKGWDYSGIHDALRSSGFVIYAGQGELYREMFRICTMGDIRDEDMARLLASMEELICGRSTQ